MLELAHAPLPDSPTESVADMDDERRSESPGRRETDSDFVRHVRATDVGVSTIWRWANILTTLVCCGFLAGVFYTQTRNMAQAIEKLSIKVDSSVIAAAASDKQTALNTRELETMKRDNTRLENDVRELRGVIDTMRNMREAYVYSAAGVRSNQSKLSSTVPP